jgi:phosphoglycolate phosphatase-like HAD superfamily hydrolase
LFARALLRKTGLPLTAELTAQVQAAHREVYLEYVDTVRALPGSVELLQLLSRLGASWAVATSSLRVTRNQRCTCSACPRMSR